MFASRRSDCVGFLGRWGHGLKGVDGKGVKEFMGYYEGCFVFTWVHLAKSWEARGKHT